MTPFTLPSGRVVELHEPTFGDELHVVAISTEGMEEMIYAKCAVMVPALTREEIAGMDRHDGRALISEIGRIWDGRPEEQEAPFGNGSAPPSEASPSMNRKQRRALSNSESANA